MTRQMDYGQEPNDVAFAKLLWPCIISHI